MCSPTADRPSRAISSRCVHAASCAEPSRDSSLVASGTAENDRQGNASPADRLRRHADGRLVGVMALIRRRRWTQSSTMTSTSSARVAVFRQLSNFPRSGIGAEAAGPLHQVQVDSVQHSPGPVEEWWAAKRCVADWRAVTWRSHGNDFTESLKWTRSPSPASNETGITSPSCSRRCSSDHHRRRHTASPLLAPGALGKVYPSSSDDWLPGAPARSLVVTAGCGRVDRDRLDQHDLAMSVSPTSCWPSWP